jgi:uncharacterized OsmC-like protein
LADKPLSAGGTDTGLNPYEQPLGTFSSCTAMTIRIYIEGEARLLSGVEVALTNRQVVAAHRWDCASATAL